MSTAKPKAIQLLVMLKYGAQDFDSLAKEKGLKRLFLHAASIEFTHPRTEKRLKVEAPLGKELESVLSQLKHSKG